MDSTSRRRVLATTATALGVGLAGCSGGGEDTTTDGDDGGDDDGDDTETEMTDTDGGTTESGMASVTVGPNGELSFSPASLTVAVGDTVEWSWSSGGHNIVVESQPDGADWGGTEGEASKTYGSGHTHTHTFETAGTYSYYCQPHRGAGMTGEIVVE